jgi:hypothetical protein
MTGHLYGQLEEAAIRGKIFSLNQIGSANRRFFHKN